jgi:DNA modification methylase
MGKVVYVGDCLKIMRRLPSESVDMIFADPPFNIGKKYNDKSTTDNRSDYYNWCAAWIAEAIISPTLGTLAETFQRFFLHVHP